MTGGNFDPASVSEGKKEHARGWERKDLSGLVTVERPFLNKVMSKLIRNPNQVKKQQRRTGGQRGS
jgi:hypothetical protein